MTYDLCGDCLHSRLTHAQQTLSEKTFWFCAVCKKLCDNEEYHTEHKASGITVTYEGITKHDI